MVESVPSVAVYKVENGDKDIDVFNLLKYRIFMSIAILNALGCPATARRVWRHMSSIYAYKTISKRISEMTGREILSHVNNKKTKNDRGVLRYTLSAQGKRNLKAYNERRQNGFNLRLKKVPKKMDWSGISLLPDYKPEED